mgnify:CR=1 FL=1
MTASHKASEPSAAYFVQPAGVDSNLKGATDAMRRAALRARQVAEQTGTCLVVSRQGEVVRVPPQKRK